MENYKDTEILKNLGLQQNLKRKPITLGAKRLILNYIKNNIEYSVIKCKYCIFFSVLSKIKKNSSRIENKKYA